MSNLTKMLAIATALDKSAVVTPQSHRLEFKRGKGGFYRLFVAIAPTASTMISGDVDRIAEEHGCDGNLFKNAGKVETVTFVDHDERKPDQPAA